MSWTLEQAANDLERYVLRKEPPAIEAAKVLIDHARRERTCKPETEVLDAVDIGVGLLERLVDNCSECGAPLTCDYSSNTPWRSVLPNYCPNCGAKVVNR